MRSKLLIAVLVAVLSGLGGMAAQKHEQKQEQEAPPTAKDVILRFVQGVGKRLVGAAQEFPEELYNYRPNEEVRTFAEILLHVARSNDLIASRIEQRPPADLKQFAYSGKEQAVATLGNSFSTVVAAIEKNPDPKGMPAWLYAVNHGSEHYGNLVTYYRLNGLVPPASR